MVYQIEFVRWNEGDPEPDVVARLEGLFSTEDEAFAHAEPLMQEFSAKGATAFRVFECGETPTPLPGRPVRVQRD